MIHLFNRVKTNFVGKGFVEKGEDFLIYVTGDMHGDFSRFNSKAIRKLKKGDTLIICGDFGFIWDGSKKEKAILERIGKFRFSVLFVDGCHENFDLLKEYEISEWNGGKARIISGGLVHLMRGEVYTIEGKKIFTFGGGQSTDRDLRRLGKSWWEEEVSSEDDINNGIANLEKCDYIVDYVVTHEPPYSIQEFMGMSNPHNFGVMEQLKNNGKFKKWFFGSQHVNKKIPPRFYALFKKVEKLD